MRRKYTVLRFIGSVMKVLGVILGILTILSALAICGAGATIGQELDRWNRGLSGGTSGLGILGGLFGGVLTALLPILAGGSLAMLLYAAGESVYLGIDIEENTRITTTLLEQIVRLPVPARPTLPQPVNPPLANHEPGTLSLVKNFCPRCGTKVSSSDQSCPSCGFSLIEEE